MDIIKQLKKLLMLGFILTAAVFIQSCGQDKPETKTEEEHHDEHGDEHGGEVALTEEQIKFMGIETQKLQLQNVSGYIKVNGEVAINPDQESKVGSIIPGRIKKIYVREGSFVRAGQTLALIENLDLVNAQVEYLEAKHEYEHAKLEYERQSKLASDNIGSRKELAKLKADYEHAVVGMKSAEQKLFSYKIPKSMLENYEDTTDHSELQRYYPISAPIAGTVVGRNVTVGQYVETSGDMFHIVNTSTVFVDLNVFEQDLPYVSQGQKVSLEVSVNPYEVYEGTVTYINKVFDDQKRTVKVRVAINNKREKLLPNMFVAARIYINQESVLAVPLSALETEGESKFIFVKTDEVKEIERHEEHDEHKEDEEKEHKDEQKNGEEKNGEEKNEKGIVFKKVAVNTGISDDKFVQVFPIDELKRGEEIVTKGTFYLKSELKKGELQEHDH
jgi:cobalt-zinc-cadmium efflux system membrane fusion protein